MNAPVSQAAAPRVVSSTPKLGKVLGLRDGDALIVVDVQRDFLPGGSLAVTGGDQIIPRLNAYMAAFEARHLPVFLTRDWHPDRHCSFRDEGGPWPLHCVRGTHGADWPDRLAVPNDAWVISKATEPDHEAYSGFEGTALITLLRDRNVQRLFVAGLATDYCVRATVLDARKHGFDVVVLGDAIRAVEAEPGASMRALKDMIEHGASVFESSRSRARTRRTASMTH